MLCLSLLVVTHYSMSNILDYLVKHMCWVDPSYCQELEPFISLCSFQVGLFIVCQLLMSGNLLLLRFMCGLAPLSLSPYLFSLPLFGRYFIIVHRVILFDLGGLLCLVMSRLQLQQCLACLSPINSLQYRVQILKDYSWNLFIHCVVYQHGSSCYGLLLMG